MNGPGYVERPVTQLLGLWWAVFYALIPALIVAGIVLLAGNSSSASGIVAVGAFVLSWFVWAFLIRCGFALLNMERLMKDRL